MKIILLSTFGPKASTAGNVKGSFFQNLIWKLLDLKYKIILKGPVTTLLSIFGPKAATAGNAKGSFSLNSILEVLEEKHKIILKGPVTFPATAEF